MKNALSPPPVQAALGSVPQTGGLTTVSPRARLGGGRPGKEARRRARKAKRARREAALLDKQPAPWLQAVPPDETVFGTTCPADTALIMAEEVVARGGRFVVGFYADGSRPCYVLATVNICSGRDCARDHRGLARAIFRFLVRDLDAGNPYLALCVSPGWDWRGVD